MIDLYPSNVLKIANRIPGSRIAQYMYRKGVKNYNLCGYFCVAYVMQDETGMDDIDAFLDYWEVNAGKLWKTLFQNNLGRRTSATDLKNLVLAYTSENEILPLGSVLSKPDVYAKMLETHQAIVGVQVDWRGYPVGKGIAHWCVLEHLTVVDNEYAIAGLYNPFNNAVRPISWQELMISTGASKNGLWIAR